MSFGSILTKNIVYRSLNIATNIFITLLLTRLMNVQGYGVLSLLVANASIFSLISCLGAESGITYHYASKTIRPGKIFSIIYFVIAFQLGLFVISELIYHGITGHYWLIKGKEIQFLLWGVAYLFSITVIDKYTAFFNGSHLYTTCNKIIFVSNLITFILFGILYFLGSPQSIFFYLEVFISGNLLQAFILVLIFHISSKIRLQFLETEKKDWRLFFSYSFVVFITNVVQFLAYRVDYWLVDFYQGKASLGLYALAVKLGQLFWVMPILFATIVFPQVADKEKKYDETKILALIRFTNVIIIPGAIVAFIFAGWVIPFVFGENYKGSVVPFSFLLPGLIFFCMSIVLAAYFAGKNQVHVNLIGSVLCFTVVLILDLLLIPSMGIKGAAIATSIAYSANAFYYLWRFSRQNKTKLLSFFLWRKADNKYLFEGKKNLLNTPI